MTKFLKSRVRSWRTGTTTFLVALASMLLSGQVADARETSAVPRACFTCIGEASGCGANEHIDVKGSSLSGDFHDECTYYGGGGGLCGEHNWCNPFASVLAEKVQALVADNNIEELMRLRATEPDLHVYGPRRAIQVSGCDDNMIAHIALSEQQFAALAQ